MPNISPHDKMIHMGWIMIIVVGICVILFVKDFSNIPDLAKILSFALSFASLLLALIAIAQSLLSSSSTTELYTTIISASENIRRNSESLGAIADEVKSNINLIGKRIDEPAAKLLTSIETMSQNASDLRGQAAEITRNTAEVKAVLSNSVTYAQPEHKDTDTLMFDPKTISRGQVLALYMCIKSHKTNLDFDPSNFHKSKTLGMYYLATVSSFSTFGLMEIQEAGSRYRVISLLRLEASVDTVLDAAQKYVDDVSGEVVKAVDEYFGEASAIIRSRLEKKNTAVSE